ncbi:hypothetical protein CGLAU_11600 [Corynebacterium glaucum]|uniref:Uncharacterized protein n=1 Tax=Corynebacterium glaucum TaxID=187491 RepID=A0A1Q2HZH8_9CORY|nr:hypothetical protein CGLAU_11600 [Corynebacterium glaucum]
MRGGRETVTIRFGGFMDTDVGNQVGNQVGNVVL